MDELGWITTNNEFLRELNAEELQKLEKQECATEFKKKKLEVEAQKNWDRFYHRNSDHFFKDRHWTKRDFEIILDDLDLSNNLVFLEAGCGVGNMLLPVGAYFSTWTLCGFDFSQNALNILNRRATELGVSVQTSLVDLTSADPDEVELTKLPIADILSLIFVLSAISPEKQRQAVQNLRKFLRTGSTVIVRDYGALDHAMIRFGRGAKLGERFYTRQDGTRAYFFMKEELIRLFEEFGFETRRCEYLYKKTVNHKEKLSADRVFVQARFVMK